MNRGFLSVVLLVVVSVTTQCQGERIVISATATTISPGVTPELTVRCGLEADGNSQSTVSRVNTIVIRRAEGSIQREVGKIVYGQRATAGSWATGATVTGDLSNNVGYLQANWSSPGHVQAGQYNCEIVALEIDGTNIKFKSNIQVDSTGQNVESLEASIDQCKQDIEALKKVVEDGQKEIVDLKKTFGHGQREIDSLNKMLGDGQREFDDLKKTVGDGQREFDDLKKTVGDGQREIDSLNKTVGDGQREFDSLKKTVGDGQREIDSLNKTVGDGQREFDDLKKTVNDLKTNITGLSPVHNEEGSVYCDNSDSWGERFKDRETVQEVRFSTPYARNPLVILSPVSLDVAKISNHRFWIATRDLSPTGFKIACGTWADTLLYRITVRWISIVA